MINLMQYGLIGPVLALVAWTLVAWLWLYVTRIPAMQSAGIKPQEGAVSGSLSNDRMPRIARQVADNYNHLHEQPTIFYALALAAHSIGAADEWSVRFAWAYVGLRVLHSLVQNTVNIVVLRFTVFTLGTFAIAALLVRTVMLLGA